MTNSSEKETSQALNRDLSWCATRTYKIMVEVKTEVIMQQIDVILVSNSCDTIGVGIIVKQNS